MNNVMMEIQKIQTDAHLLAKLNLDGAVQLAFVGQTVQMVL